MTVRGTVRSVRVLELEQSNVPNVATYLTASEGPVLRITVTLLAVAPIEAQLPVQPTKLETPAVQTVPAVGLLIYMWASPNIVQGQRLLALERLQSKDHVVVLLPESCLREHR